MNLGDPHWSHLDPTFGLSAYIVVVRDQQQLYATLF